MPNYNFECQDCHEPRLVKDPQIVTLIKKPSIIAALIYQGARMQVTATSLMGGFGKRTMQLSEKMIELSRLVADDGGNLENVVYDATNLEMWVYLPVCTWSLFYSVQ